MLELNFATGKPGDSGRRDRTTRSKPSELCWLSISPDDRIVYAAMLGYVTSFFLDGNVLSIAKDPACPPVPGDGRFRALKWNRVERPERQLGHVAIPYNSSQGLAGL